MSEAQILVATNNEIVQIRVTGRATFQCSQSLRDFCVNIVVTPVSKIIIDLSECVTMDSTFMGVLAMLGLRAKAKGIPVEVVNADKSQKGLLTGLGLGKLFGFTQTANSEVNWETLCAAVADDSDSNNQLEKAQTILDAHESLVKVDFNNFPKFKNVLEFLKEDIQRLKRANSQRKGQDTKDA